MHPLRVTVIANDVLHLRRDERHIPAPDAETIPIVPIFLQTLSNNCLALTCGCPALFHQGERTIVRLLPVLA